MAEHICMTRHQHPLGVDWDGAITERPAPTPLVVAAVNGASQPIVLACPICRTQYDLDGQLIGKPNTYRPLTNAKDFTGAAGRLIDAGIGEQGEIV